MYVRRLPNSVPLGLGDLGNVLAVSATVSVFVPKRRGGSLSF